MQRSMNVYHGKDIEFFMCPCRDCEGDGDDIIPTYYSRKHAEDEGWVFTDNWRYKDSSLPEEDFVAVCPSCAKKIEWRKK